MNEILRLENIKKTIGEGGAANAALLAVAILALSDAGLKRRLAAFRRAQTKSVLAQKLP